MRTLIITLILATAILAPGCASSQSFGGSDVSMESRLDDIRLAAETATFAALAVGDADTDQAEHVHEVAILVQVWSSDPNVPTDSIRKLAVQYLSSEPALVLLATRIEAMLRDHIAREDPTGEVSDVRASISAAASGVESGAALYMAIDGVEG